jgi:hypothetical protein
MVRSFRTMNQYWFNTLTGGQLFSFTLDPAGEGVTGWVAWAVVCYGPQPNALGTSAGAGVVTAPVRGANRLPSVIRSATRNQTM